MSSSRSETEQLGTLTAAVVAFAAQRDWSAFHDPKNLAMALASEVGELCALLRWIPNVRADAEASSQRMNASISDELGDIGILWLLLCSRVQIDPAKVVNRKLEKNAKMYPLRRSRGRSERPSIRREKRK